MTDSDRVRRIRWRIFQRPAQEQRVEIFGDLERLIDDLYPYRWAITVAAVVLLGLLAAAGYARGWHRVIWRHRLLSAGIGVPLLLVAGIIGYYTLSPLWTRTTLYEESPLAAVALAQPSGNTTTVT